MAPLQIFADDTAFANLHRLTNHQSAHTTTHTNLCSPASSQVCTCRIRKDLCRVPAQIPANLYRRLVGTGWCSGKFPVGQNTGFLFAEASSAVLARQLLPVLLCVDMSPALVLCGGGPLKVHVLFPYTLACAVALVRTGHAVAL